MARLIVTKTYRNTVPPAVDQFDAAFDSIELFFNITGVGADNIQDFSIPGSKLEDNAATETKLASSSVGEQNLQASSVSLQKLALEVLEGLFPTACVVPYGGDTAPSGWLLCDGTPVSRTLYSRLYNVVGNRFGHGDNTSTFNVPDLRGRFLRMIDGGAGRDPDSVVRGAMNPGGATGPMVGSVQGHQIASHTHEVEGAPLSQFWNGFADPGQGLPAAPQTSASGGNESRPENAYMNFIIKT